MLNKMFLTFVGKIKHLRLISIPFFKCHLLQREIILMLNKTSRCSIGLSKVLHVQTFFYVTVLVSLSREIS